MTVRPEHPLSGRFDVVLLGCGGAGLAILHHLGVGARKTGTPLRVGVVDPVNRLAEPTHDRTWCFWLESATVDSGWVGTVASGRWQQLEAISAAGESVPVHPAPLEYVMVASDHYADLVGREVDSSSLQVTWMSDPAVADQVEGTWVFDSRPPRQQVDEPQLLWQNFYGEFRRFDADVFDPNRATLMDFRVPQRPGDTAFGYCLPLDACTALVEYTRFTPARLDSTQYRKGLDEYLESLQLGPSWTLHHEEGAIPMMARPFRPRLAPGRFGVGTAGGATRASTGYTFAAMQRQASGIARAVVSGREPVPPPPYPLRHRWLDAVMLEALRGELSGGDFFPEFFARNPGSRALRFLGGTTTPAEDLAVVAVTPSGPMLRAVSRLAVRSL